MDVAVFQDSSETYLPLAIKYRSKLRSVSGLIPLDVLPIRPNPPIWSNILSSAASTSLEEYVRHRATATGAVGASSATRADGHPASQAPDAIVAPRAIHSLRVVFCSILIAR